MDKQMILLLAVMLITALYAAGQKTKKAKKRCVQTVTVVMALFSGLRTWWFGDLIKYYTLYLHCSGEQWREYVFEKPANMGIRLFFHYGNAVGLSYDFCIFIIAAFAAITLGILIFKYSPSPYFSYLMYIAMGFYMFTFSGLKQTIAMGFLCLAMIAIFEGRIVKFIIWTVAGGLFHAPALIFLAAYPFARKRIDWTYFAILAAIIAAVFVFRNQIVSWLSEAYYEDSSDLISSDRLGGRFLMMLAILALGLYMRPIRKGDAQYNYVFNIMVVAAALQTFSMYDNNFTRLTDYYYQFVVLFVPMLMQPAYEQVADGASREGARVHDKSLYILLGIGITAFALWYYKGYIDGSWIMMKDYKFCWEIDPYSLYGK